MVSAACAAVPRPSATTAAADKTRNDLMASLPINVSSLYRATLLRAARRSAQPKARERDAVLPLDRQLHRPVRREAAVVGGIDDVGDEVRAFRQLDHGDVVGKLVGKGLVIGDVIDDPAHERAASAGAFPRPAIAQARRAFAPRRQPGAVAPGAALELQMTLGESTPIGRADRCYFRRGERR